MGAAAGDDRVRRLEESLVHVLGPSQEDQPVRRPAVKGAGQARHLGPLPIDLFLGHGHLVVELGNLVLEIGDLVGLGVDLVAQLLLADPALVEGGAQALLVAQGSGQVPPKAGGQLVEECLVRIRSRAGPRARARQRGRRWIGGGRRGRTRGRRRRGRRLGGEQESGRQQDQAGAGALHAWSLRSPFQAVRLPIAIPARIKPAARSWTATAPTPGSTSAKVAFAYRWASSHAPPTTAAANAPANAPVVSPSTTNGPRSIQPRAASRLIS